MSTPLIWIFIPFGMALILIALQSKPSLSHALSCIFSLSLFLLALVFPEDLVFIVGDRRIEFASQVFIFGRTLQISSANLTMVALLYLINFLWNLGNSAFKTSSWFNALSLMITAFWITTLAVEPFLYAAVIIELIALLSVPLFSPRGEKTDQGLLRYLVFQTLAMSLILLSGWMLAGIGTAPSANPLIIRSAMMVLFGFALWMAAFPFHSWLPMISQTSHPWVVSFLLGAMQTALVVFLLYFLDQYAWLRNLPQLYESLRWVGVVMIMMAGLLSALQTNLSRIFGYLVLAETGYSILAIGLTEQGGLPYMAMLFLPRLLSYWLWAWSLSALKQTAPQKSLDIPSLRGLLHHYPFISVGILISLLSLVGLPLLPVFPTKQMIWFLTLKTNPEMMVWIVIGILGMLISFLRLLHNFIAPAEQEPDEQLPHESLRIAIPLCIVLLVMIVIGIAPQLLLPRFTEILAPFVHLIASP
ncbi:MAG: proton-conducting transporter membrane subunit [Anaerolineaceae bacterium]